MSFGNRDDAPTDLDRLKRRLEQVEVVLAMVLERLDALEADNDA